MADDDPTLRAMLEEVLDSNRYLTLGTTGSDGDPRVSPVYFTHDGYRTLYWVSSPDAQHSRNIDAHPLVEGVVFDSSAEPGQTRAVYAGARAMQVPDDELPAECARAFAKIGAGAKAFTPDELSGDHPLRLYRATVSSLEVHMRGGDPTYGTGVDRRLAVPLSPED